VISGVDYQVVEGEGMEEGLILAERPSSGTPHAVDTKHIY